jgi:hypothetical protein
VNRRREADHRIRRRSLVIQILDEVRVPNETSHEQNHHYSDDVNDDDGDYWDE